MVDEGSRELLKEAFPELLTATGDIADKFLDVNTNMETMTEKRVPDAAKSLQEKMNPEMSHLAEYAAGAANAVKGINEQLDRLDGRHVTASVEVGGGGGVSQYQGGTSYVPQSGLAYLHQGEAVIPAGQNRSGGFSGNITLNVTGTGDPNATAAAVIQKLQDRGILPRTAVR